MAITRCEMESMVYAGSSLIGKTLEEVEKEYDVKVEIPVLLTSGQIYDPRNLSKVIQENMYLKVEGSWEDVGRVCKDCA